MRLDTYTSAILLDNFWDGMSLAELGRARSTEVRAEVEAPAGCAVAFAEPLDLTKQLDRLLSEHARDMTSNSED